MTKIATGLGQLLRKIRIDSGEVLMHMASKLKMSPAFLSAIELGKRSVPSDFVTNLITNYDLDNDYIIPDSSDILSVQLEKLSSDEKCVFVLCTCAFYIYDYNPKLIGM